MRLPRLTEPPVLRDRERSPTVLVVDDETLTRRISATALERDGCTVIEASGGRQAIEMLEQQKPDVVLLDLVMPEVDGFEVCRAVRERDGGEDTAVLVMTGLEDVESIRRAYSAGATDFVTKPVTPLLLTQRIRYLHRASSALAELRSTEKRLRASREAISRLAYSDSLTGLPNRAFLSRHLEHVLALSARNGVAAGVLCLDLDLFKRINDTLGHSAGDELLVSVGRRLQEAVRRSDCVARNSVAPPDEPGDAVARLGGDEFVVVLHGLRRPEDAGLVASRIQEALSAPFYVARSQVFVNASIGIAVFPNDGSNAETLLQNADTAMYHAKERGRGAHAFYTASLSDAARRRLDVEAALRIALDEDQLEVFYQPKLDTQGGEVMGVEALCRWLHPEWGHVPPPEFIGVAEDTGLILRLGEWVLRAACRQIQAWQDEGFPPMGVAVNVAARQFRDDGFAAMVAEVLAETGLDPTLLELEITEGTLMDETDRGIAVLTELHQLGVRVAIDDFGTGYSSLAYLSRFPIDTIKVDRSFVSSVTEDASNAAITEAIIAMGRSLRLDVVAEGVETSDQLEFLRKRDCAKVQGYLFSRPLPAAELGLWLLQHQPSKKSGEAP
ncbi:MAG: EAL domain-containing protein [Polyangiaceae bacterium]